VNPTRIFAVALATAVGLALLAYAAAVPLAYHPQDAARLRLSWSARPERIEVCRQVSAEEQARREEHMRLRVECEGRFATYALRVDVDNRAIGETVIHGAGLRHDRPLFLLKDYPVPAGRHRVRVMLTRREKLDNDTAASNAAVVPDADTGLYAGRAQREATERERRARAAIPPSLVLDTAFVFAPRHVALVTFNAERRVLELKAGASSQ
jgi:hypothetical protein